MTGVARPLKKTCACAALSVRRPSLPVTIWNHPSVNGVTGVSGVGDERCVSSPQVGLPHPVTRSYPGPGAYGPSGSAVQFGSLWKPQVTAFGEPL